MQPKAYTVDSRPTLMRKAVLVILILTALHPMISQTALDGTAFEPQFSGAAGVEVIEEIEPNNANNAGQAVYPGVMWLEVQLTCGMTDTIGLPFG